ncbi:MAG: hypothetical protein IPI34_02460 [bacterium]|nr:hypothetical protein [bacterium]
MRLLMIVLLLIASTTVMAQDCVIGNTQNVVSFEAGWLGTGVAYAQFTDPITTCFCEHGIAIDEIRISLVLDTGATVRLIAQLLKVNDVAGCDVPGQVLATSGERLVDGITAQGLYEIVIPCDFQCALMADSYFLVVTISEANGGVEMPFTGGTTGVPDKQAPGDPCTSYRNPGTGWEDLIGAGFKGGLPILALTTCYDPIGDDFHTWGRVKRIYR